VAIRFKCEGDRSERHPSRAIIAGARRSARKELAAIAVDALCFHNQRAVELPPDFEPSGRAFTANWAHRMRVKSTCAVLDGRWLLGG
jgi:hypothetical protein